MYVEDIPYSNSRQCSTATQLFHNATGFMRKPSSTNRLEIAMANPKHTHSLSFLMKHTGVVPGQTGGLEVTILKPSFINFLCFAPLKSILPASTRGIPKALPNMFYSGLATTGTQARQVSPIHRPRPGGTLPMGSTAH